MTKSYLRVAAALLLLAPLSACTQGADAPPGDPDAAHDTSDAVIRGKKTTDFPEVVLIDMFSSVDEFKAGESGSACTGTLIAPRVVLTAAHCVFGFAFWTVTAPLVGEARTSQTALLADPKFNINSFLRGEVSDVAALVLSDPIELAQYPTVETRRLTGGTRAVLVGRIADVLDGQTNGGQLGEVSNADVFVSNPVTLRDGAPFGNPNDYAVSRVGQSGDSGGPIFLPDTHTIVSIESRFTFNVEFDPRLDIASNFIKQTLAQQGAK